MKPEITTLIAGLGGAIIGFLSSIITIWVSKHYESKENYRNALIQVAIKDFEISKEVVFHNKVGTIPPLDAYILHHAKIIQLIIDDKMTPENIKKVLEETNKINSIYKNYK